MKKVLLLILIISSCQSKKEMTLEELNNAKWKPLDKGIEYISQENKSGSTNDSIEYKMKGSAGKSLMLSSVDYNTIQPWIHPRLDSIIDKKLSNSKRGYLKIDLYE